MNSADYRIEEFVDGNFTFISKKAFEKLNSFFKASKKNVESNERFVSKNKPLFDNPRYAGLDLRVDDVRFAYGLSVEELDRALFLIENEENFDKEMTEIFS